MADEENVAEEESGEKPKKKGGKLKLIIIVLLLLIILGVLGGVGYMMFLKPKPDETAEMANAKKAAAPKKEVKEGTGIGMLYPLENFIVNMADAGGSRYLRVTLQLELDETKKFSEALDMRKPQLRDAILTVLASKRYEEVSSAQGKLILKQELLRRLNSLVTEGTIVNIYFTEFVAQ
jgi:flagellar FliL protein